jgi:hypothetical protein
VQQVIVLRLHLQLITLLLPVVVAAVGMPVAVVVQADLEQALGLR